MHNIDIIYWGMVQEHTSIHIFGPPNIEYIFIALNSFSKFLVTKLKCFHFYHHRGLTLEVKLSIFMRPCLSFLLFFPFHTETHL